MTWQFHNIIGEKFGRLTVVRNTVWYYPKRTEKVYLCQCSCGSELLLSRKSLTNGCKKSCGCLRPGPVPGSRGVRKPKTPRQRHGHAGTFKKANKSLTYASWGSMRNTGFHVPEWSFFLNFLRDLGEKPPGTKLTRRNVDLCHSKNNSYWKPVRKLQTDAP